MARESLKAVAKTAEVGHVAKGNPAKSFILKDKKLRWASDMSILCGPSLWKMTNARWQVQPIKGS